jgi:hypothetical protein
MPSPAKLSTEEDYASNPVGPGKTDAVILKAKWASLKAEFIELSITGKDIHWPSLAKKYGFQPQTCRNKASTQKWYAEIEEARLKRESILEQKLSERSSMALDELNKDFMTSEVAIRKRHATVARGLQVKAIARLREFNLADFSPRDTLAMLKLGIEEERFAMGLPETYRGKPEDGSEVSGYEPIAQQLGGHAKVKSLGAFLLKQLQDTSLDSLLAVTDLEVKDAPTPAVQVIAPAPNKPKIIITKRKAENV